VHSIESVTLGEEGLSDMARREQRATGKDEGSLQTPEEHVRGREEPVQGPHSKEGQGGCVASGGTAEFG
jgi:hypothetical protein